MKKLEFNEIILLKPQHSLYIPLGDVGTCQKCKQGIGDMLKKKPKSNQLSLFSDVGFGWC